MSLTVYKRPWRRTTLNDSNGNFTVHYNGRRTIVVTRSDDEAQRNRKRKQWWKEVNAGRKVISGVAKIMHQGHWHLWYREKELEVPSHFDTAIYSLNGQIRAVSKVKILYPRIRITSKEVLKFTDYLAQSILESNEELSPDERIYGVEDIEATRWIFYAPQDVTNNISNFCWNEDCPRKITLFTELQREDRKKEKKRSRAMKESLEAKEHKSEEGNDGKGSKYIGNGRKDKGYCSRAQEKIQNHGNYVKCKGRRYEKADKRKRNYVQYGGRRNGKAEKKNGNPITYKPRRNGKAKNGKEKVAKKRKMNYKVHNHGNKGKKAQKKKIKNKNGNHYSSNNTEHKRGRKTNQLRNRDGILKGNEDNDYSLGNMAHKSEIKANELRNGNGIIKENENNDYSLGNMEYKSEIQANELRNGDGIIEGNEDNDYSLGNVANKSEFKANELPNGDGIIKENEDNDHSLNNMEYKSEIRANELRNGDGIIKGNKDNDYSSNNQACKPEMKINELPNGNEDRRGNDGNKKRMKSKFAVICRGCKTASYCSRKCQKHDWKKYHSSFCKKGRISSDIGLFCLSSPGYHCWY